MTARSRLRLWARIRRAAPAGPCATPAVSTTCEACSTSCRAQTSHTWCRRMRSRRKSSSASHASSNSIRCARPCATTMAEETSVRSPQQSEERVPPPVVDTPEWGLVLVRRQALELALENARATQKGELAEATFRGLLERVLAAPGLVHRRVPSQAGDAPSEPAARVTHSLECLGPANRDRRPLSRVARLRNARASHEPDSRACRDR